MAMSSNKSSSLAASSRPNPNARNSEVSNPMRRSFSGNPFAKPSVIANPRSFNPKTPANSPSDFPPRNSVGSRESSGSFRDLDDKENGKDQNLKSAKVRSAALLKSPKNFMSPTISASSKISVSPGKKILIERNEPARTSVSSIDGKSPIRKVTFAEPLECGDFKPDVGVEEKLETLSNEVHNKEVIHSASLISEDLKSETIPLNPNNEIESSFETVTEEPDCVNLDPTFKLSPTPPPVSSTTTILAPLDADPLMPPYDPKTNYLSPRPQFLHYKPNPRIELYKERDGIKLEESFISGSYSDTEVTEDSQSEGSLKESEDVSSDETVKEEEGHASEPSLTRTLTPEATEVTEDSQSEGSQKESEDVSSDETVKEEEGHASEPSLTRTLTPEATEVTEDSQSEGSQKESEDVSSDETVKEEEGHASEPSPTRTLTPEGNVEANEMPKPRFSMRSKAIALLLFLSVAFISISVINAPVIDHTVFKDLTIFADAYESSDFPEFAKANLVRFSESARANFDGLARNLHIWFTKSISSMSEFISTLGGGQKLVHMQYCNLTALNEFTAVDNYPIYGDGEMKIVDTPEVDPPVLNFEEDDAATKIDTYDDIGDFSVENYESAYEEQAQQDMGVTRVENASDPSESEELEGQRPTLIESELTLQLAEVSETEHLVREVDIKDRPGLNSEAADFHVEASEAASLKAKEAEENDAIINFENQPGLVDTEAAEIHFEVFEAGNSEANQAQEKDAEVNVERHSYMGPKDQPDLDSEIAEIHTEVYDDETGDTQLLRVDAVGLPSHMLLTLLLCGGTVVIAATAFNWSRKGKSRSTITSSVEQPLSAKTMHANSLAVPIEQISPDKPSLRNGPTETDVFGESCPSEMSSFQKSSSYSRKGVKELNEAQSLEKKPKKNCRRESLASSSDYSTGSPSSYGSFTTYEKISSKHGYGDGETITPVRRSSRLRSQATSPL